MDRQPDVLQALLHCDLYAEGWEGPGVYPGITQRQFAMNSLSNSLLKKFHNEETDKNRDESALQLFLNCNKACSEYEGPKPQSTLDTLVIGEMKSIIYDFFNPKYLRISKEDNSYKAYREPFLLTLEAIARNFGLGNGSNIGADETHLYSKLVESTMSHTNDILPLLFRQALSIDKLWSDVEACRAARFGYERVTGSRLSFVPKSRVISRTICTEPVLNMLFQLGIGNVIRGRLARYFSIDLATQPSFNATLARIGSEYGRYGTIDLSSASDTISINLIKAILPPEPVNWLMRCRSPYTILPDGREVELHMISSMGNGFTFPLQTMLFSSLVMAAYRVFSIKLEKNDSRRIGNFAVFGDDIIVDKRVYDTVCRCLGILGFTVNHDKSYNEGDFRESCGSDFMSGYNVRGVYLKRLRTAGDFYSAINRLNRWSARHGVLLPRTVGYLRGGCRFIGVPYDEADDAGIKVPLSLLRRPHYTSNRAIRYLANVNCVRRLRVPSVDSDMSESEAAAVRAPFEREGHVYCASGVLLCFLAGSIRDGYLGLRSSNPKAVLRKRICPGWDESVFARGESREFADRWKAACEANLVS